MLRPCCLYTFNTLTTTLAIVHTEITTVPPSSALVQPAAPYKNPWYFIPARFTTTTTTTSTITATTTSTTTTTYLHFKPALLCMRMAWESCRDPPRPAPPRPAQPSPAQTRPTKPMCRPAAGVR
ncbi:hypothetical protein E2C01_037047 [Portunus trituberculatus]|uniref:Uncharacterized protein n=1 Tax=Portunus trituberculatus TaxID=210409 RepID=A0A5B7F8B2_PORTR|nr:hypothetical protein [Portunus trituberculatus]